MRTVVVTPLQSGISRTRNHNLRVGDVDGEGRDEIVYDACVIDNNVEGPFTTGLGHASCPTRTADSGVC
jgi:rhamnogalacturonan endolyase